MAAFFRKEDYLIPTFVRWRCAIAERFITSGKETWARLETLLRFDPKRDSYRAFEAAKGAFLTSMAFEKSVDDRLYHLITNTTLLFERSESAMSIHDEYIDVPEIERTEFIAGLEHQYRKTGADLLFQMYKTYQVLIDIFIKGIDEDREAYRKDSSKRGARSSYVLLLSLIKRLMPSERYRVSYPGIGLLRYRFLQMALIRAIDQSGINPNSSHDLELISRLVIALNPLLFISDADQIRRYYCLNGTDQLVLEAYGTLRFDRGRTQEDVVRHIEGVLSEQKARSAHPMGPITHSLDLFAGEMVQRAIGGIHDARRTEFEISNEVGIVQGTEHFSRFKRRWFHLATEDQVQGIWEQGGLYYFRTHQAGHAHYPFFNHTEQYEAACFIDQKGYSEQLRRVSDLWEAAPVTYNGMQLPLTSQLAGIQKLAKQHAVIMGEADFVSQQGDSFAAVGDIIPMFMLAIAGYENFASYRAMIENALAFNVSVEDIDREVARRSRLDGGVAITWDRRAIRTEGEAVYQCGREVVPVDFIGPGINLANRLCTRDPRVIEQIEQELAFVPGSTERQAPWRVHIKDGALYNVGIAVDERARAELLTHSRVVRVKQDAPITLERVFPITSLHDDLLSRFLFPEDELRLTMVRFLGIPKQTTTMFRGLLRYAGEAILKSYEDEPIRVYEFIPESRNIDSFYHLFMTHHGNEWQKAIDFHAERSSG